MDRPSGGYGGNDGRLHKGGRPDNGLHMVREREKEVSSMSPPFLACSTVLLVLFSEFRSTKRTRFGENRTPLSSTVSGRVIQQGNPRKDHKLSLRCL